MGSAEHGVGFRSKPVANGHEVEMDPLLVTSADEWTEVPADRRKHKVTDEELSPTNSHMGQVHMQTRGIYLVLIPVMLAMLIYIGSFLWSRIWGVKVIRIAMKEGWQAGLPGAGAMFFQVIAFMWARTILNFQYRHGGTALAAFRVLWGEGGIRRLYKGLIPALMLAPLARFGDTASNESMQSLLNSHASTQYLPMWVKTICSSIAAGLFRMAILPIDTLKTKMQVEGRDAFDALLSKVRTHGPGCLFDGWLAYQASIMISHYPWFVTRNTLRSVMDTAFWGVYRDVIIGLSASLVADLTSNSMRVVKVYKQTSAQPITYREAMRAIILADGVSGLMFRGMTTKLCTNAVQSVLFNVAWERLRLMW